jgi:hypothetical protein
MFDPKVYKDGWRKARADAGLCEACGKNPRDGEKLKCAECLRRDREKVKAYQRGQKAAGICRCKAPLEPGRTVCDDCNQKAKGRNRRHRELAIRHYGGRCACCGETEMVFLAIDHVENNGAAHRKEVGRNIARVLVKLGFPPGYQVLCHNCNWAKRILGRCPHQDREGERA